jgi:hypothetical protein
MEQKKIEKLAINLNELVSENSVNPQEIYEELGKIFTSQKEYFQKLITPSIFLKLILYIYSYRAFGDISGGERMYNEGFFVNLLTTDNKPSNISCDNCDGDGSTTCSTCAGDGSERCYECDGNGKVDCSTCNGNEVIDCENCSGSGEIGDDVECPDCNGDGTLTCPDCKGEGSVECDDCKGEGYIRCSDCYGDGTEECSECSGHGEIESEDKIDFTEYSVFSWDKDLKTLCEIRVETVDPVMEKINFFNKINAITLTTWDEQEVPAIPFDGDMVYCFSFTTNIDELDAKVIFTNLKRGASISFHDGTIFYYA